MRGQEGFTSRGRTHGCALSDRTPAPPRWRSPPVAALAIFVPSYARASHQRLSAPICAPCWSTKTARLRGGSGHPPVGIARPGPSRAFLHLHVSFRGCPCRPPSGLMPKPRATRRSAAIELARSARSARLVKSVCEKNRATKAAFAPSLGSAPFETSAKSPRVTCREGWRGAGPVASRLGRGSPTPSTLSSARTRRRSGGQSDAVFVMEGRAKWGT